MLSQPLMRITQIGEAGAKVGMVEVYSHRRRGVPKNRLDDRGIGTGPQPNQGPAQAPAVRRVSSLRCGPRRPDALPCSVGSTASAGRCLDGSLDQLRHGFWLRHK